MILINSTKLLFTNFSLVYKSFIYKLTTFIIALAGVFAFSSNAFGILINAGVFTSFKNIFTGGIANVFTNINTTILQFLDVAKANFSTVALPLIIACIVLYILANTLTSMDTLAIDSCIETKMSANYKSSYIAAYLKNFWSALFYAFIKTLIFLLFDVLVVFAMIELVPIILASNLKFLWIFLAIVSFVIYFALKRTIFCFLAPNIVSAEDNVFKSFGINFKVLSKNFFLILGNNIVLVLIFLFVNMLFGLLTFGVGFIIVIPTTIIYAQTFNMVAYYEVKGSRYYLDTNNIRSPKKQNEKQKLEDILDLV